MIILGIILLVFSISFFIVSLIIHKQNTQLNKLNQEQAKQNAVQQQECVLKENNAKFYEQQAAEKLSQAERLTLKNLDEQKQIDALLAKKQNELANVQYLINEAKKNAKSATKDFKKDSTEAAANYFDILEQTYVQKEKEFDDKIDKLKAAAAQCQDDLDKIRDNRAAAMEALRKEKQIKEDKTQYSLIPSVDDLEDIKTLSRIRNQLKKPRILAMLVWQTYYQPIAKKKFIEILGKNTVCGIYKITNQLTDECYIGQSVDCYKRWNDHVKCGLGIDMPPGNKLYKAMEEYGVENFTFELLQQCDKESLDQQEQYFITLYEADKYGYNGRKQIK